MTTRYPLVVRQNTLPIGVRIVGALLGAGLLFIGLVTWGLEQEYGGNADRPEYVVAQEADSFVVIGEDGQVVHRADTSKDVDAWIERQRGSRNFTIPVILLALGGLTVAAAASPVLPGLRRDESA